MEILGGRKMKNKKYELDLFSFYDYVGMEEHFEEMALKGWMIEKISFGFYVYKKILPKKVKFHISYAQKVIDEYDVVLDDELEEFRDLVEYSGWKFVCENNGIDIFFSEDTNPNPVETDPYIRTISIKNKMKKVVLLFAFVIFVLTMTNYSFFVNTILRNPIAFASDFMKINEVFFESLIVIYAIIYLVDYYIWKKKALARAELGEFALKSSRVASITSYFLIALFLFEFILYLAQAAYFGFSFALINQIVGFAIFILAIKARDFFREKMKSKGMDRGKVRFRSFLILILIFLIGDLACDFFFDDDLVKIENMPYSVEDFSDKKASDIFPIELRDSFLSSQRILGQSNEEGEPELWFYYDEVTVHMPFLYEPYKRRILGENADYKVADDSSWGANEVYYSKKNGRERYILFYDDKILKMNFDWDVTEKQKAKIRRKTMR